MTISTKSAFLVTALSSVSNVLAHGQLNSFAVDGVVYPGNIPGETSFDSPIRAINDISPVKGATNRAMNCGQDAQIATQVVPANPGSQLTFEWKTEKENWVHNTGPMMTYLSTCGNTTCDQFDAINAQWFKIDQAGKKDDSTWFQADLQQGDTYTTTLPMNLAPGDYLVRHEIIALHLATEKGGAEFYPSCTQIRVSGNGTGTPSETVSFPGAYSDDDPGIFDPTVFNPGANYTFPGPDPDHNLQSTGSAITGPVSSNSDSSKKVKAARRSFSNAFRTPEWTEKIVKRSYSNAFRSPDWEHAKAARSETVHRPRRVSHIMRRLGNMPA